MFIECSSIIDMDKGYRLRENQILRHELLSKVENILDSGKLILGEEVKLFEDKLSEYTKNNHSIGFSSGTDALVAILSSLKLKSDDEVIVPALTFAATAISVVLAGAKPVFCDVDEQTFNISVDNIEKVITKKTKVIIVVHLYGLMANIDSIKKLADQYSLLLLEDAAQALGSAVTIDLDRKISPGNLSYAAMFSFYPTKNLAAIGDAGAVVTNSIDLHNYATAFRSYGRIDNSFVQKGTNSRLDEIQAGVLNVKFNYLEEFLSKRIEIAKRYLNEIKNDKITLPYSACSYRHTYHQFVIRVGNRNKFLESSIKNGTVVDIHYQNPLHHEKIFSNYVNVRNELKVVDQLCQEIVSLPIGPFLKEWEVSKIIEWINKY